MKCKNVQKMLVRFLDEELPEKKRVLISEHLAGCDECRGRLEQAKKALTWAGTWEDRELSPTFLTRLNARIRAEEAVPARGRFVWSLRAQHVLAGVAAACVVFLGGYFAALQVLGGRDKPQAVGRVAKVDSGPQKDSTALAERAEAERLVVGVQKMKMVFGEKLSDSAYAQLNEIQRALAVRGGMDANDMAALEGLQTAELLIREGDYVRARGVLDEAERDHPDHPLAPYVRIAKVLAAPQPSTGSDFLRRAYATLLQETVGDPGALYSEVTNIPQQMAELREYGWGKIVKSADRLNPLNAWNFVERRILGDEAENP